MTEPTANGVAADDILDAYPDEVVAALEIRDAFRRRLAAANAGLEFVVSDLDRWVPGSTVRVAFLDGDKQLHADIADATRQITDACNIVLDFGHDPATGEFRRWTLNDAEYAAEIRVSFDRRGNFSLVGTDSTDRTLGPGPVGGAPNQRSLNLGGWTATQRPQRWRGTTRHEFLHAVGFQHSHQNMRGPCQAAFRWEDDEGYAPTQDSRGAFVADAEGRRPGIYTYLAGPPNEWPRAKVDHNLRTAEGPEVVVGPFDRASVMLYVFESFFYKTSPSPRAPNGNGVDISAGDKRGLQLLYPATESGMQEVAGRAAKAREALDGLDAGLESTTGGPVSSPYLDRVAELLDAYPA